MKLKYLLIVILSAAAPAFAQHTDEHVDEHGHHEESPYIQFTDEQLRDFGVSTETAGSAELAIETVLPGEIRLNEETMAHIAPRYPGIVKTVRKRLGDTVSQGDVLAVLESTETLVEFELKSLISGTIIEKHITVGEILERGETAFIVSDQSEVWADISVYQQDLPYIAKGQKVTISAGHGVVPAEASIHYLGPVVSEETRNGLARVFLPNPDRRWKPGMFITAHVETDTLHVPLAVKKTALQQLDNRPVVFVREPEGFEAREVVTGRESSTHVEILSGLKPGEVYVSERSFLLKAQKLKSTIDPEAGHNH